MRFLLLKIIGLAGLLLACDLTPKDPLRLEVAVGSYIEQVATNAASVRLGTAFAIKLRQSGQPIATAVAYSIRGPLGWNENQVVAFNGSANGLWLNAPVKGAAPVLGEYIVQASTVEKTVEKRISLVSPADGLPLTNIQTQTSGPVEARVVDVTWDKVPGALGYIVKIIDGTTGLKIGPTKYTVQTEAQFGLGVMSPTRRYFAVVVALNFDTTLDNPTWNTVIVASDSIAEVVHSEPTFIRSEAFPSERKDNGLEERLEVK